MTCATGTMGRGIDHLVLAVRDLDAASERHGAMGFTLTPRAEHPWGTANRLVQLDGCYLELLAVAEPARIPAHGAGAFSFGAFNRDYLERREGLSMLVLDSADAEADRAAFERAGLPVYAPFVFSRQARLAGGGAATFSFALTFTSDAQAPGIGFFACERRMTAPFWQAAYQRHANTARTVREALMVSERPEAHGPFLAAFAGTDGFGPTEGGIAVTTARGRIAVLTPAAAAARWGAALPEGIGEPHLAAFTLEVADLAAARGALEAGHVPHERRGAELRVAAVDALGVAIAFAASSAPHGPRVGPLL